MHEIHLKERMMPVPRNSGFRMEGYWIWCGSVIKAEDGRYHMFASRWPKTQPMHPGWIFSSEIVRAVSDTPTGLYEFAEVVLPARGAQYWDGRATHNPRIMKRGKGYVLYYMGSTHPFPDPRYQVKHEDPIVVVHFPFLHFAQICYKLNHNSIITDYAFAATKSPIYNKRSIL